MTTKNDLQRLTFEVIYQHEHVPKPYEMFGTCRECGAVPYPTPSGKVNVRWLRPVEVTE